MRKGGNCVWVKKKLEYFISYVNSAFSAFFCLLRNRGEICVVGLDFVDVWGNCFFLKKNLRSYLLLV